MQMPVFQSIARDLAERQEQLGTSCCVGVHMHTESQPQGDPVQAPLRAEESLGDPCSQKTGGSPGESPERTASFQSLGCLPNGIALSVPDQASAFTEE